MRIMKLPPISQAVVSIAYKAEDRPALIVPGGLLYFCIMKQVYSNSISAL